MSQKPSKWQRTGLSSIQITKLCTLAGQAFKVAQGRGDPRTEDGADKFRKAGQKEAAQIESLKEAHQGHYLFLRGYWFTILGNLEQAFYDFLNAGDANEAMRQMKWRMMGQMAHLADAIATKRLREIATGLQAEPLTDAQAADEAWRYAQYIALNGLFKCSLANLPLEGVEQTGFTLNGRATAMLGKGKAENRNKSQRASTRAKKTTPEASLESPSRALEISLPPVHTARHAPADTMQL